MGSVGVAIASMCQHFLSGPKVCILRPFSWVIVFIAGLIPVCEGSLLEEAYELLYPVFPAVRLVQQDSMAGILIFESDYYNILDKKRIDSQEDAIVNYWATRLHGGISGPNHGIGISLEDRRPYASWSITDGNYTAEVVQELRTATVTVARYIPAGEIGFHIGGLSSSYGSPDKSNAGTIGGFYFDLTRVPFSLEAKLLTDQLFHLNEILTHTRNNNFRTFPISLKSSRAVLRISALKPKWHAALETDWSSMGEGIENATENRMPVGLVFQKGGVRVSAGYTPGCTLLVDLRAERWAGFLKNKDFLLADSLTVRRFAAGLVLWSQKGYHMSGFVDYLYGISQRGRLDTRPFSSWTLFKRLEYSLRDLDFTWFEPGIEGGHTLSRGKHNLTFGGSAAYLRMFATGDIKQMERVVMIPVATKRFSGKIWGIRALLMKASLSYALHLSHFTIRLGISQRILGDPFGKAAEVGRAEHTDEGNVRTRGGTKIDGSLQFRL